MNKIVNGGNKEFRSNNLVSLLEWCLNYKSSIFFFINTPDTYYKVKIDYDDSSKGDYLSGHYDCILIVTITDKKDQSIYGTLFVNSDDYTLDDAIEVFTEKYLTRNININKLYETSKSIGGTMGTTRR